MNEKEREISQRKKSSKKKNENECPHIRNIKIEKNLTICKRCGTIIHTEKILKYTFTKYLIKPINYCKGLDISPLKILKNLMGNFKEKKLFPSFYLNTRTKLINTLIFLNNKFNGSLTTLYLSISFLDRIFPTFNFIDSNEEKKMDLITLSSYILAYKYYEIDHYLNHLDYSFFQYKYNISRNELFNYEVLCLKKLDYNLQEVGIYSYLKLLMYTGFILNSEKINISLIKIYRKIIRFFDSILLKAKILKKFSEVEIAFSIIFLIRRKYGLSEKIFKEEILKQFYHFEYEKFEGCVDYIGNLYGLNNIELYENSEKEKSEKEKLEKKNSENEKNLKEEEEEKKVENYNFLKTERKRKKTRKLIYLLNQTSLDDKNESNNNNSIKPKKSSYLLNPLILNNFSTSNVENNKETEVPFLDSRNEENLNILVPNKNLDNIKNLIKAQKAKIENKKNVEFENEKNNNNYNDYIKNIKPKKRLTVKLNTQRNTLKLEKLRMNELKNYLLNNKNSSKELSVDFQRNHYRYNSSIDKSNENSSKFLSFNSLIENSDEKNSRNHTKYNSILFNKPIYTNRSDAKKEKNKRFILSMNIKKEPVIFPLIGN